MAQFITMKTFYLNGQEIKVNDRDLLATGGEGCVFTKGKTAYKIYHQGKQVIQAKKLVELANLKHPRILAPEHPLLDDKGKIIGFSMPYRDKTDPLCQYAAQSWRVQNGLTIDDIAKIILKLQESVAWTHQNKCLIVDLNPFNAIVDRKDQDPLHIDVDSWQTPQFPATALMDSVKDPKAINGFTPGSDWFSFAVLAAELYLCIHPYRGTHPDFKPAQWKDRMTKGVSVFNPKVKLPSSANNFSVIPKLHRAWLEAVLEQGERRSPPLPGALGAVTTHLVAPVANNGQVLSHLVHAYPTRVRRAFFHAGECFAVTEDGVYHGNKLIMTGGRKRHLDFIPVKGEKPLIGEWHSAQGRLDIFDRQGNVWQTIETPGYFVAQNKLFTGDTNWIKENSIINAGSKFILSSKAVAQAIQHARFGAGLVLQPMLGTCQITIPLPKGGVQTVRLRELDKVEPISAVGIWPFVQIVGRENGVVKVWTAKLELNGSAVIQSQEMDDHEPPAFTVLDRGIAARFSSHGLDLFRDINQPMRFEKPGIPLGYRLTTDGDHVYILGQEISRIKTS